KIKYSNNSSYTADSPLRSITTADFSTTTLPAPTTFTGTGQSTTSILWSWPAVTGAVSYDVHDENHALLANVPGTSWTEINLSENTAYQRHVHAKNVGLGLRSPEAVTYTLAHAPLATDLTLTVITGAQIDVRVAALPNRTWGGSGANIEY